MSIAALMTQAAAVAAPPKAHAERAPADREGVTHESVPSSPPRVISAQRRASASSPVTTTSSIATDVARYLPTEAVALYTGVLPFLVPKTTSLSHQDYTSRWVLAIGVGVFAVFYAVGIYKREVQARGGTFKWPPKTTITVIAAYAAWVLVIPGSAFNSWGWYTPAIGAGLGIALSAVIGLFQLWFGSAETP
jgi:hypothetical protein